MNRRLGMRRLECWLSAEYLSIFPCSQLSIFGLQPRYPQHTSGRRGDPLSCWYVPTHSHYKGPSGLNQSFVCSSTQPKQQVVSKSLHLPSRMATWILNTTWAALTAVLWGPYTSSSEPPSDFFPARPNGLLGRRYVLQTKLGAGVWSNTWLVSDKTKRYNHYFVHQSFAEFLVS